MPLSASAVRSAEAALSAAERGISTNIRSVWGKFGGQRAESRIESTMSADWMVDWAISKYHGPVDERRRAHTASTAATVSRAAKSLDQDLLAGAEAPGDAATLAWPECMTVYDRSVTPQLVGHRDNSLYQRSGRPCQAPPASTSAIWLVSMDAMIDRVNRPATCIRSGGSLRAGRFRKCHPVHANRRRSRRCPR